MTNYRIIDSNDAVKTGMIIEQYTHWTNRRIIWSAKNEADLIDKANDAADHACAETGDWDMKTFDGCYNWIRHDARSTAIFRYDDRYNLDEDDEKIMREAFYLGWAEEYDEDEED